PLKTAMGHDRSFGDVGAMSALAPLCGLKSDMSRGPRSEPTYAVQQIARLFDRLASIRGTGVTECQRALLWFDFCRPNDPRPLFGVAGQKLSKLSGRIRRHHQSPKIDETRFDG